MTAKPIPLAWSTVRLIAEDAVRLGLATARLHGDDAGAQAYEGMRDALVTLTATPSAADALLASLGAVPADLRALLDEHAEAEMAYSDLMNAYTEGRAMERGAEALAVDNVDAARSALRDWTRAHPSPPAPVPLRAIVEAAYGAGWDERGNRERDVAATGEHGTPKYETRCEAYVLSVLAQAAPHAERMNAEDDPRGYWTDTRARKPGEWNIVDRAPVDATREATLEPATGDGILAAFGEMAKPAIVANNVNRMPGTVWIGETKQPTAPPPTPGPLSDEELTDLRVKVGYLTDSGSLALTERDRGRITFTRADDKARHEVAQFPYTYQAEAVVALVGAADRLFAMAAACAPLEREVARLQSDNSRLTQGVLNFSLTTRVNADMAAEINGLTAEVARLREASAARVTPLTAEMLAPALEASNDEILAGKGCLAWATRILSHLGPVALPGVDDTARLVAFADALKAALGHRAWEDTDVDVLRRAIATLPRATSDAPVVNADGSWYVQPGQWFAPLVTVGRYAVQVVDNGGWCDNDDLSDGTRQAIAAALYRAPVKAGGGLTVGALPHAPVHGGDLSRCYFDAAAKAPREAHEVGLIAVADMAVQRYVENEARKHAAPSTRPPSPQPPAMPLVEHDVETRRLIERIAYHHADSCRYEQANCEYSSGDRGSPGDIDEDCTCEVIELLRHLGLAPTDGAGEGAP